LCHCEVTDPKILWDSTWEVLAKDMQYRRRRILNIQTLQLSNSQKKAYALLEIEKIMRQAGKSMKDYPQIEMPSEDQLGEIRNRLMNEELNYDKDKHSDDHQRIYNNLNDCQKIAFHAIVESVDTSQGKLIFIEGHGDTCKTYLWKEITTKIQSEGNIVLDVASCAIAALLLGGGRTPHS
jgi:hypothetical protein